MFSRMINTEWSLFKVYGLELFYMTLRSESGNCFADFREGAPILAREICEVPGGVKINSDICLLSMSQFDKIEYTEFNKNHKLIEPSFIISQLALLRRMEIAKDNIDKSNQYNMADIYDNKTTFAGNPSNGDLVALNTVSLVTDFKPTLSVMVTFKQIVEHLGEVESKYLCVFKDSSNIKSADDVKTKLLSGLLSSDDAKIHQLYTRGNSMSLLDHSGDLKLPSNTEMVTSTLAFNSFDNGISLYNLTFLHLAKNANPDVDLNKFTFMTPAV